LGWPGKLSAALVLLPVSLARVVVGRRTMSAELLLATPRNSNAAAIVAKRTFSAS
jgi:hypothetical protein